MVESNPQHSERGVLRFPWEAEPYEVEIHYRGSATAWVTHVKPPEGATTDRFPVSVDWLEPSS